MRDDASVDINPLALRVIRERSGMSVSRLAEAAGTGQSHLSNVENGRRKASCELIVALATALKVELPAILKDPDRYVLEGAAAPEPPRMGVPIPADARKRAS